MNLQSNSSNWESEDRQYATTSLKPLSNVTSQGILPYLTLNKEVLLNIVWFSSFLVLNRENQGLQLHLSVSSDMFLFGIYKSTSILYAKSKHKFIC